MTDEKVRHIPVTETKEGFYRVCPKINRYTGVRKCTKEDGKDCEHLVGTKKWPDGSWSIVCNYNGGEHSDVQLY